MDARRANDRIAEKAERLHFVSRVPMLCECSGRNCRTVVLVGLDDYRKIRESSEAFLTAPGHDADSELERRMPGYEIRRGTRERTHDGDGDRRSA
jgi:ferredoxin